MWAINYYTNGQDDINFMANKMNEDAAPLRDDTYQSDTSFDIKSY